MSYANTPQALIAEAHALSAGISEHYRSKISPSQRQKKTLCAVAAQEHALALVAGTPGQQEIDVDSHLLAVAVRPVLGLQQDADLVRQLHKHDCTCCSELQPNACMPHALWIHGSTSSSPGIG